MAFWRKQMGLMKWDATFSVGVVAMDEQHKNLMEALNDLHAAMSNGEATAVATQLLSKLARYTRNHFQAEEALLTRTGYPQLTAHHAKHVQLNNEVEQYIKRMQTGERALSVHLLHFLRDWLTVHIQKEDRAYGSWLNAHGTH